MSPFASEILSDIPNHFEGSATVLDLCEWFGCTPAAIKEPLRELLWDGLIWQVHGRLTTKQPRLKRARVFLARGFSLAVAADVAVWDRTTFLKPRA